MTGAAVLGENSDPVARRCAAALAVYVAAVGWLTWPLAAHLATHIAVPDATVRFDVLHTAWALAWETHALTTSPTRLVDANIYHPAPLALFYGPTGFGALPWFAPTFLVTGNPALATNVMLVVSLALTAWTVHLAVVGFTGSHLGGLVAASALLTNPWLLWIAPAAPIYAVLQYWPLIVLLAARPEPRLRLLVPLVVLQALVDPVYMGVGVLAPLGLLALARLARRGTRRAGLHLVVGILLAVLCLLPVLAGYAAVRAANPDLAGQTVHVTMLHWTTSVRQAFQSTPAAMLAPALLLIAVGAVVAAFGGRPGLGARGWRHSALWTVTGLLLAMPGLLPRSTFGARWLDGLYAMAALRLPGRLAIGAMIAGAILVGIAFTTCAGMLGNRLARGLAAVLLVTGLSGTYWRGAWHPTFAADGVPAYPIAEMPAPDPELLRAIDATPGALLEIPLGPRATSPTLHAEAMYRSTYHWRPLVNGYGSYWPAGFAERLVLAERLPDPGAVATLNVSFDVTMVLVRWDRLSSAERERWGPLAEGEVLQGRLRPAVSTREGTLFLVRAEGDLTDGRRAPL